VSTRCSQSSLLNPSVADAEVGQRVVQLSLGRGERVDAGTLEEQLPVARALDRGRAAYQRQGRDE
jgi:hypothetical protein